MIYVDAVVLGGGMYGCKIAIALRSLGLDVLLLEPNRILSGATAANQGRVHGGYHYPRSYHTALSAQKYYRRFLADHAPAIEANYKHLYAIAEGSLTTPDEFEALCAKVGAPLDPIRTPSMFNASMVQQVYEVEEVTFNMTKMHDFVGMQLHVAGVTKWDVAGVILSASEDRVTVQAGDRLIRAGYVFNCTYGQINATWPIRIRLKKEHTEVALLRVFNRELADTDITIMDGPFWSLMRFPSHGCHALTHVKYTPHDEWFPARESEPDTLQQTHVHEMIEDAQRYVPAINQSMYEGSRYTTRVVLERNEPDDGRPILWEYSAQSPRIISVLGSKFNSVYDAIAKVESGEWVRDRGATGVLAVGRRGLVGHTGFVGSHLDAPGRFTDRANSKNPLAPGHYDLIVCAAPYAEKWRANERPDVDAAQIEALKEMLSHCTTDEFVLVGTVDALRIEAGMYGKQRLWFENWLRDRYENLRIVRLPALFGKGMKKNVLYDLLDASNPVVCNFDSTYQWYPIERLWDDITVTRNADLRFRNLVTSPIKMGWIIENYFPNSTPLMCDCTGCERITKYDVKDEHGYVLDEPCVKAALHKFIMEDPRWVSQSSSPPSSGPTT